MATQSHSTTDAQGTLTRGGMTYKKQIKCGPTQVWVCRDCGHRLGRYQKANGRFHYHCSECEDTYFVHYKANRINTHTVATYSGSEADN
jgi:uncharacterized protein YlaI